MTKPLCSLATVLFLPVAALGQEQLVGSWEGSISEGERGVRTVLHLSLDGEGALVGTVDSPEQNGFGFSLSELEFEDGAFSFRVPDTHGAWEGELDAEGGELVGSWKQRGSVLALSFERVEVDPLVGSWEGLGDFGAIELRIVFHVGTREDGGFGASMVSPDQSPSMVPVAAVDVGADGAVRFDVAVVGAVYEGQLDAQKTLIEGHLLQAGGKYPLDLEKVGAPTALHRPQTPQPPFPYRTEDVEYENAAVGNRLAGTLTLPEEGAPFPAVILISGSGLQDRNEEIFGHKPFLVIADHLTRRGIAVLRVDDRGVGGSTGDVLAVTSEDFARDVLAGIEYLKSRSDIRADRIGLMGHSEGGMIGPMVASGDVGGAEAKRDVAFLVLLAGLGIGGDELLFLQATLLAKAAGATDAAVEMNRKMQAELFEVLREQTDPAKLRRRLEEVLKRRAGGAASAQLEQLASAWFQYFVNYDPLPVLRKVSCPVLAVNGSRDLQVPPEENLSGIAAALKSGGNEDFEVKEYPELNHLFQHCRTGTVSEYGEIEETFSVEVLEDLTAWINKRALGD